MATKRLGKPSISPSEAKRVREAIERLLATERYRGNKTKLGKDIGISQPAVTQLLSGTNKASIDTAKHVARLEKVPLTAYLDDTAAADVTSQFPSKQRAAQSARGLLVAEWAIQQMLDEEPPRGIVSDPGPMFWFRRIEQLVAAGPNGGQGPIPVRDEPQSDSPDRGRRGRRRASRHP